MKDDVYEIAILEIPDVLKVSSVRMIPRPDTRGQQAPAGALKVKSTADSNTNSVHRQTEVDRLHALGIKGMKSRLPKIRISHTNILASGKGVKVAIMDTGIDWHHKALGGCFGEGCKVSFGKDFIGDTYDQTGIPVADGEHDPENMS